MSAASPRGEAARAEHLGVWQLLPWYGNETVSAEEGVRIGEHISNCEQCREELIRCKHVSVAARARSEGWLPSPEHFAQVLDFIQRSETRSERFTKRAVLIVSGLRRWFTAAPLSMQWAFGLQCVLLAVAAGALLVPGNGPAPAYRTLSRPDAMAAADHAHLRVVFAPDISGQELRDLLQTIGAQIVYGPSPMGVYTIELPFPATARSQLEKALVIVRAHPKVRFSAAPGEPSRP